MSVRMSSLHKRTISDTGAWGVVSLGTQWYVLMGMTHLTRHKRCFVEGANFFAHLAQQRTIVVCCGAWNQNKHP
jgi:hypothetical protein